MAEKVRTQSLSPTNAEFACVQRGMLDCIATHCKIVVAYLGFHLATGSLDSDNLQCPICRQMLVEAVMDALLDDGAGYISTGHLPSPEQVQKLVRDAHVRFKSNDEGENSQVYPALARVPRD